VKPDPTFLGTIQDVHGATVSVALDENTVAGLAFIRGEAYRIGQIGSFVRIPVGFTDLYGIVTQVGAGAVPEAISASQPHGFRWLTVQLVGETQPRRGFERGISQYPTISDPAHLVTEDHLHRIYGSVSDGNAIEIGRIASADSVPALIDIDRFVLRHAAVLGATGSGKSTTVASLLTAFSSPERFPSSRVLLLDLHGEYAQALAERATLFRINPDTTKGEKALALPYWAMTSDELLPLLFGTIPDQDRNIVLERLTETKRQWVKSHPQSGLTEATTTADTPVPFSVHQFWFDLHIAVYATYSAQGTAQNEQTRAYELANGNPIEKGDPLAVVPPKFKPHTQAAGPDKIWQPHLVLNLRRQVDFLAARLRDPRFEFLFSPGAWSAGTDGNVTKDLDAWLAEWIGDSKPISILDLSGIPVSVLVELVGALLRIVYDALFWSRHLPEGGRKRPLLITLEEAHTYLSQAASNPASTIVRRIAKEGRKYGVGLMLVSQRPSEIDATILSQCGTLVAMRLSNSADRSHVTSATTDHLEGLLDMLPILRTGEALIVGEAVKLPMRVLVNAPPENKRPDSGDPRVFEASSQSGWNQSFAIGDFARVITAWRKQNPRITTAPQTAPPALSASAKIPSAKPAKK
jgi:hypothetical protein